MTLVKILSLSTTYLILFASGQLVHTSSGADICNGTSFAVPPNGNCPQDTQLVKGCCQPCQGCTAGFRKKMDECLSPCIPCEDGTWRTEEFDQTYCLPCMDCSLIYRVEKTECTRTKSSQCGECEYGYYEDPYTVLEGIPMSCPKCEEYSGVEECNDYLNIIEDTTMKEVTVGIDVEVTKEPSIVIPLLVLVIGVGAAVVLVIVFRSRRRMCGIKPSSDMILHNDRDRTGPDLERGKLLNGANSVELKEINGQAERTVPNGQIQKQDEKHENDTDTQLSVCEGDALCGRSIGETSDVGLDGAHPGDASSSRHRIPGVVTEGSSL